MKIGKLPNNVLEKIVFDNIKKKRDDVLVGAGVGRDNAILDFGEYVCIVSTDPITGTTEDIGKLALYISCNDVASSGAEPMGVLLTIMAPEDITEKEIDKIMIEAGKAAGELNVEIVGGHTEITDAVNRVIISTTVIGKQFKNKVLNPLDAKIGDKIIMTKYVGIEGTSIIAKEFSEELKNEIPQHLVEEALELHEHISVVKEGIICGKIGVPYMHDITEGGILGAVWEASKAVNKGIKLYKDRIPMKESTKAISDFLDIDPYRLISSGSMLVIAPKDKVNFIQDSLKEEGIDSSIIGELIKEGIVMNEDGKIVEIEPPCSDELYKALGRGK